MRKYDSLSLDLHEKKSLRLVLKNIPIHNDHLY